MLQTNQTIQTVPIRISVPYIRGASVFKEIIVFSIYIEGTSFRARPETCAVLCKNLGIDQMVSFEFIDHTIITDKNTNEEVFELIRDIVQELMALDIIE
jgi:hypothetical protein